MGLLASKSLISKQPWGLCLKSVDESIVMLWGAIQEVTTVASGYPESMFSKKLWFVCSWFAYPFAYASPIFFLLWLSMHKADWNIQWPYTITSSLPGALVTASWAGRPGVRGRVANTESRKETVQYPIHLSGHKLGFFTQRCNSPMVRYSLNEKAHHCHG